MRAVILPPFASAIQPYRAAAGAFCVQDAGVGERGLSLAQRSSTPRYPSASVEKPVSAVVMLAHRAALADGVRVRLVSGRGPGARDPHGPLSPSAHSDHADRRGIAGSHDDGGGRMSLRVEPPGSRRSAVERGRLTCPCHESGRRQDDRRSERGFVERRLPRARLSFRKSSPAVSRTAGRTTVGRIARSTVPARRSYASTIGEDGSSPTRASPARSAASFSRSKAPKDFGEFLELKLESDGPGSFEAVEIGAAHLTPLPDGWVRVLVPMHLLNPYGQPFDRLRLRGKKRLSKEWVLLDGLGLTAPSKTGPPARTFPTKDAALSVRCKAPTVPISPLIYGVANEKEVEDMRAGARRMGGNPTTRYNWQLGDAWSTGSDYFFQNVKIDFTYQSFIDNGLARKQAVAITVPIIGWVAKDRNSYSFPVSVYGKQKEVDPHHPDIGNGVGPNGKELKPGDPSRTSMPASPEWVRQWVQSIRADDAKRGVRGVTVVHSRQRARPLEFHPSRHSPRAARV